jgi:hypothetical protein
MHQLRNRKVNEKHAVIMVNYFGFKVKVHPIRGPEGPRGGVEV